MSTVWDPTTKQAALDAIATEILHCRACRRHKTGLPVPGEGNPDAEILFIGEAPGKEEAKTGRPFVGRSGKLLRRLIRETGFAEDEVFITSPVKYLPKHVTPTRAEINHARIHLQKQLEIINPRIIVLLGRVACEAMMGPEVNYASLRGTAIERDDLLYFVTYHPAAALYSQKLLPVLESQFKLITKELHKKRTRVRKCGNKKKE